MSTIRDTFFENKAAGALWDVAVSIKRGNPLPLDVNSVFESYEALQAYASGVLAYPGQIVAVVNENSTGVYYLDQELNIQPVGVIPVGDNKSIEINNDVISLFNFGKYFYKYNNLLAAYEKTAVSDETPWAAGLEPRVVQDGDDFVLGWFEPVSYDGDISSLQTAVTSLESAVGKKATDTTDATGIYADLDAKANASDVYTKDETNSAIATAVANADHLKRKIVNSVNDINVDAEDALEYIYMVPKANDDVTTADRYDEYMVIVDGSTRYIEKVGDWSVDLSDYWKETEAKTYLGDNFYNKSEVDELINDFVASSELDNYYDKAIIDTALANKVTAETGKDLVATSEIEKLASVSEGAEPNYVKSVETNELNVDDEGKLSVVAVPQNKVTGLEASLNNKVTVQTSEYNGVQTAWTLLSPENAAKLNALVLGDEGVEISGKVNAENVEGLASWVVANRNDVNGLFSEANENKLDGLFDKVNSSEFTVTTDESDNKTQLNISSIAMDKVVGLSDALSNKASNDSITNLDSRVEDLEEFANANTYSEDKVTIFDSITWSDLS